MPLDPEYHHKTIRKECIDEQNLISQRMTWLLMIQAFLFTTFAISLANGAVKHFWWFTFLAVPFIGILIAFAANITIKTAVDTLKFWHKKEEQFLKDHADYEPLSRSGRGEHIHWLSMTFPQAVPYLFMVLWFSLAILGLLQAWTSLIPSTP